MVATQTFLEFSPLFGEDSHFDLYYSDGLKPPTSYVGHQSSILNIFFPEVDEKFLVCVQSSPALSSL